VSELRDRLERLATRGSRRGADAVLSDAQRTALFRQHESECDREEEAGVDSHPAGIEAEDKITERQRRHRGRLAELGGDPDQRHAGERIARPDLERALVQRERGRAVALRGGQVGIPDDPRERIAGRRRGRSVIRPRDRSRAIARAPARGGEQIGDDAEPGQRARDRR